MVEEAGAMVEAVATVGGHGHGEGFGGRGHSKGEGHGDWQDDQVTVDWKRYNGRRLGGFIWY
jgi:hypothetical protein